MKPGYVSLTSKMIKDLNAEIKRTGVSSYYFHKHTQNSLLDIRPNTVKHWATHAQKTAPKALYDEAMKQYAQWPDGYMLARPITKAMRLKLDAEIARTNVTNIDTLLHGFELPVYLNAPTMRGVISGNAKNIYSCQWDFIIRCFKAQPSINSVEITAERMETLHSLMRDKNFRKDQILRIIDLAYPGQYSPLSIKRLVAGKLTRMKQEDWDNIITAIKTSDKRTTHATNITITESMREEFNQHLERTGASNRQLANMLAGSKYSLPSALITNIKTGYRKNIEPELWDTLLNKLRNLPDTKPKANITPLGRTQKTNNLNSKPALQKITAAYRERMDYHRKRTGVYQKAMLDGAKAPPKGLTSNMVLNWISRATRYARKEHLDWVINEYEKLPDKPERKLQTIIPAPTPPERVHITKQHRDLIDRLRKRANVTYREICEGSESIPESLSPNTITAWYNGNIKTARKDCLDWVLERLTFLSSSKT